jgi:hypothetical protein
VVVSSTRVVPIYVDCTTKGQNEELQTKYEVKGYPTVLYLNPDGSKIRGMGARDAGPVTSDLDGIAKKFPGRPSLWQNSIKGAVALGKAQKKLVALYVAKEDADPQKVTASFMKNLGDKKTKLLWTWETGTAKVLESRSLELAPAVLIFDTAKDPEELLGKATIKEGDDPKLLNQAIDEILKNTKK